MEALPQLTKKLSRSLFHSSTSPCRILTALTASSSYSSASRSFRHPISSPGGDAATIHGADSWVCRRSLLGAPWYAIPTRGLKVNGSSVELRDVDSGNKVTQGLGTDETVERVFVEAKTYIYMCTDRDGKILLMDPDILDQLVVQEDLFGKNAKYLQAFSITL